MVGKVLTGNGITACGNGAYSLIGGDDLSDGERDELLELCRQRLDAFRDVQASYGHREAGCVFCALEGSGRVLLESELARCIADAYPLSEGHSLVIPRRHGADGLGAAEAAAGAARCPGRVDQRLGWFAQRNGGAELRGDDGADGVSCPLASDPPANR